MFNCNVRSFHKNGILLESLLHSLHQKPNVIVTTETWNAEENVQLCKLQGYKDFHVFRKRIVTSGGVGGGVSIFFNSFLPGEIVEELSVCDATIEICSCRMKFGNGYMMILGIYRPHTDTISNFLLRLEEILNLEIIKRAQLVVLAGDMNIDLCNPNPVVSGGYLSLMQSLNFLPTITRPTRFSNNCTESPNLYPAENTGQSSNLDHIWLGKIDNFFSGILLTDLTDHLPTFIFFHLRPSYPKNEKICFKSRPFSQNNLDLLISDLRNTNWASILCNEQNIMDPNEACMNFTNHLNKTYCKYFPLKIKYMSEKRLSKPWFTPTQKKLIDKKSASYKKYCLGLITKEMHNFTNNEVNAAIRKAKQVFYLNSFQQARSNMRKSWSLIHNLLGTKCKKSEIAELFIGDHTYSEPSDIADQLNNYFCSIAEDLASKLPEPTTSSNMPHFENIRPNSFYLFPVTTAECIKLINSLKLTKTEIDSMPVKIFKQITHVTAFVLCRLINLSYNTGIFPDSLKIARITPLFKKGEKTNPNNYRPIASLPFISKIYERSMANRLTSFFIKYKIIHPSQFGFQRGLSTSDAIDHLTEYIYKNLNDKKSIINVLVDLRKAFDTVDIELLLKKLGSYGIRGVQLDWIRSFLTNRQQFVCVASNSSSKRPVNIGVPQGSILGPIFFLIFINDLPKCCKKLHPTLFADDTTLSIANKSYTNIIPELNNELLQVFNWTITNKLTINISKTELMIFSNLNVNFSDDQIALGGENLRFTECSRFLGLEIDRKLNFSNHTAYILGKLSKQTGIFYKIRNQLPEKARLDFYYSFMYPYFSQNVIFWGKTYECHIDPIVKIQKRIVRLIDGAQFLAHTNSIFFKHKILKFCDIYKYFACIYVHKKLNSGKFLNHHARDTRNRDLAQPSFQRLTSGQHCISYQGPKAWNTLPLELRHTEKLDNFKKKLKKYLLSQYVEAAPPV